MKRRSFLKLLGIAPVAGAVGVASKPQPKIRRFSRYTKDKGGPASYRGFTFIEDNQPFTVDRILDGQGSRKMVEHYLDEKVLERRNW